MGYSPESHVAFSAFQKSSKLHFMPYAHAWLDGTVDSN